MDQQLKQKYRHDFQIMRKLVNEFDPCSFIEVGAPDDEYDALIHKLLSHIYLRQTIHKIKEIIMSDLESYFGCIDDAKYQENKEFEQQFTDDLEVFLEKLEATFSL